MELTQRLRAWTHRRQRLGEPAASPAEALRAIVAVYSFHPTAPLALAARTVAMTAADFRDLDRRRVALRVPGMRGSLFLVPRDAAGMVFAPFEQTSSRLATRLRRGEMSDDEYAAVADRVVAAAGTPLLPRELQETAGVQGLRMSMLLRTIRGEGRLLAVAEGSLRAASLRYVATDCWAPGSLAVESAGSALSDLARHYLQAYGPARVEDFAWWTGLSRRVAAQALSTHQTVDVGGGLLLPVADERAFATVKPVRDAVELLPKWDAYTMGHAPNGRARLVHPDNQPSIYVQKGLAAPGQPNVGLPGDGYPVVLVDGQAVGTWNLTLKQATVHLFDTVGPATRHRIDERLAAAGAFLAG